MGTKALQGTLHQHLVHHCLTEEEAIQPSTPTCSVGLASIVHYHNATKGFHVLFLGSRDGQLH